ncbi:hypothetical protein ACEZCY_24570 [Streptacidiphilus sp. N1-12]|uniref:Uncharacterized protein n=2 Tax=Streptacidiphilus alkalitolerans TaxID=3342712 RepID=A0ABV6V878_9ACTN
MTYPPQQGPPAPYLPPPPPTKQPKWKLAGIGCGGLLALLVVLGVVGAIVGPAKDTAASRPIPAPTQRVASITSASTSPDPTTTPTPTPTASVKPAVVKAGTLPNLVGKGLQAAQDAAQAAGFFLLKSHDALGTGRHQILDRDWKVCSQTPAPGGRALSSTVDLGAVKTGEDCPGSKPAAPKGDTITYVLTGSHADVQYGQAGSSAEGHVPMTVTKTLGHPLYYSITAQLNGGGKVTCEIKVNGKVISRATASGGYNIAMCEISQDFLTGDWTDTNGG